MAFSSDGGHVLSGSSDNTPKLWHVGTGALFGGFAGTLENRSGQRVLTRGGLVLSGTGDK